MYNTDDYKGHYMYNKPNLVSAGNNRAYLFPTLIVSSLGLIKSHHDSIKKRTPKIIKINEKSKI